VHRDDREVFTFTSSRGGCGCRKTTYQLYGYAGSGPKPREEQSYTLRHEPVHELETRESPNPKVVIGWSTEE
jgi:hypothetical protein